MAKKPDISGMGRILTILGAGLSIYAAKLSWAMIDLPGWRQEYNGFSHEEIFGSKPGFTSLIIAVVCILPAIINRKITQYISLAAAASLLGWAVYQWYDKRTYFAIQDGFTLKPGLYLHILGAVIAVIGVVWTLRKLAKRGQAG